MGKTKIEIDESLPWPEKVPILTAADICRNRFDGPNETHCLSGWCDVVFGLGLESDYKDIVWRLLRRETKDIISFNDNPRNSKSKIAAVWNRVMRKLGYVVDCDR